MARAGVENTSEGGGLYKGPFEITAAQYNTKSNYGGKMQNRVCALELTMNVVVDGKVVERNEYLTVNAFGKSVWKASEDGESASKEGRFLTDEDKGGKIQTGTPHGRFMKSLVDCGMEFPEGYDADALVGLKGVLDREDAPVKEKEDRTLAYVTKILDPDTDIEEYEDEDGDEKPVGKAPKAKFEKNGKVPAGVDKAKGKAKPADEDEDEEEEEDEDEDAEGDEEEEEEEAEESDDFSAADKLAVLKETLAVNKKGVKLKQMGQAIYAVVPKKFKQFVKQRKELAAAISEMIEAGGAKKVCTVSDDGLVKGK